MFLCNTVDSVLELDIPQNEPLDITILTNDVSLISDTRELAHESGLDSFWSRIKPKFLDSKVQNIHIVVLLTNAVVVEDDSSSPVENRDPNDEQRVDVQSRKRAISVVECIRTINLHLDKKGDAEFKANRSFLQFDTSRHIPAINVSLSTVENTSVGPKILIRKWSRDKIVPIRLNVELPETLDFSQCMISLDAVYKSIPFPLNSNLAAALIHDLQLLGKTKLRIEQLVPIASIGKSLVVFLYLYERPFPYF